MTLLRAALVSLLLLPAASAALAFDPPAPLSHPVPAHADALGAAPRGTFESCGTGARSTAELVAEHYARGEVATLPTSHSTDAGEIAVLEDDGTFSFDLLSNGSTKVLDIAAATRAFYRTHGDDYDQIAFYCASGMSTWLGSPTALASAFVIHNDTDGLGLDRFDEREAFGGPARLQSVLVMNGLHRYTDDPYEVNGIDQFTPLDYLAHEFAHRWAAYVWVDSAGTPSHQLLGRAYQHWSFLADVDASVLEGCSWARVTPDSFVTDSVTTGYGGLDLYLMGLASKAETDSVLVVNDGYNWNPPGTYVDVSYPQVGIGARGRAVYWKVDDIERQNGPRVPDAASAPHAFRLGIVLIVPNGSAASPADLAKLETFRSAFEPYFVYATRGRGTVDCSLDSHAGSVEIDHAPLADTEELFAPRPVGARITIAQGGIPLAVDAASPRLHWRLAGAGSWNEIPMSAAGPDSFAAAIPGPGVASGVEYYLTAASDSAGIEAADPPAGPLAPHAYAAGPDLTPPVIAHVKVLSQGAARLAQRLLARVTDNTALDTVWVEFAYGASPVGSIAAVAAGRDSFAVSLGYGQPIGQTIAYRFVARDKSAAANVAHSSTGFDTLRVTHDWLLDFENGDDGVGHLPPWGTYRDLWHLTTGWSSPAGGSAWMCGSDDSTAYAPHAGGLLYLPVLNDVVPGTMLRFDHHYALEQADDTRAWDGALVEVKVGGNWMPLVPASGYTHEFLHGTAPFIKHQPCWSGRSSGWRAEVFDLSPYPAPVFLRLKMLTDDYSGTDGWWVDHIRVNYPNGVVADVTPREPAIACGPPRPNPARAALALSLALPRRAEIEWALFDVQGRRAATLARGAREAGEVALSAPLPALPAGLYFSRVSVDGRAVASARVAIAR